MGSMNEAAASVVSGLTSTADARLVVADAFRLVIPDDQKFVVSEVPIEQLEFTGYAVGGLSATADTPTAGSVRSSSVVAVPLSDSRGGTAESSTTVTIFGPGDVRGIDPAQIVRRNPAPGSLTVDESVLAHIEFDRPELPWAFSAAKAQNDLAPWLTLIVVEAASVEWEPATALLPILRVPLDQLPGDLSKRHLWAHAQTPQSRGGATLSVRLSPEYAPVNLSRVIAARVLTENTDYLAALVPATDVGVRAGLGTTGGTLGPAWTTGSDTPVRLPVYDSWTFRTGPDGDFKSLALRLSGIVAPYEVGRRFIDASEPGKPLDSLPDGADGAKQVLRCALYSPSPAPTPEKATAEKATWPTAMVEALNRELDLPAAIEGAEMRTDGIPDLPIVGPRIYGSAHRGSPVVSGGDWFAQLNLAPTNRIVGGLGTRVVQRDQEQLMQAAWAQLGEVEKANRAILLAQLAELAATRLHARIGKLQQGRLLQVVGPLATRVSLTAGTTLAAQVGASATPPAVLTGSFRRSTRPGGPMLRRADDDSRARLGDLVGSDAGMRDFTRVYANPDGIGGITDASIARLDLASAASAIGIPADSLGSVLSTAGTVMKGGIAVLLTDSSRWRAPDAGFDIGGVIAERWGEELLRAPSNPAAVRVRDQRVAPLIAGIAISPVASRLPVRDQLEATAVTLNNSLISRVGRVDGPGAIIRARGVALMRGNALGGAIARPSGGGVRLNAPLSGRIGTDVPGVNLVDTSVLTPVRTDTDTAARANALTALANLATTPIAPLLDRARGLSVETLRSSMSVLVDPGGALSIAAVPRRDTLTIDTLSTVLDPTVTVRAALKGRLRLSDTIAQRWNAGVVMRPIMAAPRFDRPMYQALYDYDSEWLVPGLGLLPADDFVTVLSTNPDFMEAFLIGLSDEMGRELLWRSYPTDRRGTYFRRFWDADADELPTPIHLFPSTDLGKHVSFGGDGGSAPRAVVVVKSELVRRYPDLIIQVAKNQGTIAEPWFEKTDAPQIVAKQLFSALLQPDLALVGVDLSIEQIDQPEWWILIAEHPSATRFDRKSSDGRFADTGPGAAGFAADRLHLPTRVAFQATDLVKRGA